MSELRFWCSSKPTIAMHSAREAAICRAVGMILVLIATVIAMTSCTSTVHARWARRQDSVDYWSPKLATIPINVHGNVPDSDAAQTLARIPNGTNDAIYERSGATPTLRSTPRLELYVGGNTLPVNVTYCDKIPTLRSVEIPKDKVMLAVAICDGARLVATAREEFSPDQVSARTISHAVENMKAWLLYAISRSPSQVPTIEPG
jgi:hypothetical protein